MKMRPTIALAAAALCVGLATPPAPAGAEETHQDFWEVASTEDTVFLMDRESSHTEEDTVLISILAVTRRTTAEGQDVVFARDKIVCSAKTWDVLYKSGITADGTVVASEEPASDPHPVDEDELHWREYKLGCLQEFEPRIHLGDVSLAQAVATLRADWPKPYP
jgi:hypothetical protein